MCHRSVGLVQGALDRYRAAVAEAAAATEDSQSLQKRIAQFEAKAARMTTTIEDDVVSGLLFCVDRLFSVPLAERGEFI